MGGGQRPIYVNSQVPGRAVVNMLGLHSKGGHAMVHSEEELKMLVTASHAFAKLPFRGRDRLFSLLSFLHIGFPLGVLALT